MEEVFSLLFLTDSQILTAIADNIRRCLHRVTSRITERKVNGCTFGAQLNFRHLARTAYSHLPTGRSTNHGMDVSFVLGNDSTPLVFDTILDGNKCEQGCGNDT